MTYTIFMMMRATEAWLSLSGVDRQQFVGSDLLPIFARHETVNIRLYDAEAFSAPVSDIAVFETDNLPDYMKLIDTLRDSKFYTEPYFEVLQIIPAAEANHLRV